MADPGISALERRISGFSFEDDIPAADSVVTEDDGDLEDDDLYAQAARLEPGLASKRPYSAYPDVAIDAKREIRLIQLLPGDLWDDICCEMTVYPLNLTKSDETDENDNSPDVPDSRHFEALSYTWGSWADFDCITLNGSRDYPITHNLWTALRRLRLTTQKRRLWIDQLSINQEDDEEKVEQIPLMGSIYAQAKHVIVWLGDTPDSNVGAAVSNGQMLDQLQHALTYTSPSWFSRAWVVQEYVMARDAPKIYFGPYAFDWDELYASMFNLKTLFSSKKVRLTSQLMAFDNARTQFEKQNFLALAWTIGRTDCSISRDKVFSLLSLLTPEQRSHIRINYACPDALVFAEATFAEIATTKSLMILTLAGRRTDKYWSLPSWVIDFVSPFDPIQATPEIPGSGWYHDIMSWTHALTALNEIQKLCLKLEELARHPDPWTRCQTLLYATPTFDKNRITLHIRALQFDTVGVALPPGDGGWRANLELAASLWRPKYAACLSRVEIAYERLLNVEDNSSGDLRKCESCNQSLTALSHLYHIWDWDKATKDRHSARNGIDISFFTTGYVQYLYGYRNTAFVTATGFFGIGPPKMHMRDLIVLPYGSRFPMALRRSEDDTTWRLLGHVYVFGIMNGELVTKLPDLELPEREFVLR